METLEFDDIQSLVFTGYGKFMKYAAYHLLRIDKPAEARQWLLTLLDQTGRLGGLATLACGAKVGLSNGHHLAKHFHTKDWKVTNLTVTGDYSRP